MKRLIPFCCLVMIMSCTVEPQPIEYGVDQCAACRMIIADSRFGCELVTTKGKIYKYDAIECLIPEVLKNGTDHYAYIMVADYHQPGKLVAATNARYKIDPEIPSPMGGNLSAYSDTGSEISLGSYDWEGLLSNLSGLERYKVN